MQSSGLSQPSGVVVESEPPFVNTGKPPQPLTPFATLGQKSQHSQRIPGERQPLEGKVFFRTHEGPLRCRGTGAALTNRRCWRHFPQG